MNKHLIYSLPNDSFIDTKALQIQVPHFIFLNLQSWPVSVFIGTIYNKNKSIIK